jgi:hypothetical protein
VQDFSPADLINGVIASEAKQSYVPQQVNLLDCRVAALLEMTKKNDSRPEGLHYIFPFPFGEIIISSS